MAFYASCSCDAVFPDSGGGQGPGGPTFVVDGSAPPVPGATVSTDVPGAPDSCGCDDHPWWMWLVAGLLVGYVANE